VARGAQAPPAAGKAGGWEFVIPAKAGIQWRNFFNHWIPTFVGMTAEDYGAGFRRQDDS
jgi:hypothetical protein